MLSGTKAIEVLLPHILGTQEATDKELDRLEEAIAMFERRHDEQVGPVALQEMPKLVEKEEEAEKMHKEIYRLRLEVENLVRIRDSIPVKCRNFVRLESP